MQTFSDCVERVSRLSQEYGDVRWRIFKCKEDKAKCNGEWHLIAVPRTKTIAGIIAWQMSMATDHSDVLQDSAGEPVAGPDFAEELSLSHYNKPALVIEWVL